MSPPQELDNNKALVEDYCYGKNNKVTDRKIAFEYCIKVLQEAPKDARVLYLVGWMYEHGDGGLEKDLAKARDYYEYAAQENNTLGQGYSAKEQLLTINFPEIKTAEEWYQLGREYYDGSQGRIQNYYWARACFEKAITLNPDHHNALHFLGFIFNSHLAASDINLGKAKEFFAKAAKNNHHFAKLQLLILENPQLKTAGEWYTLGDDYYYGRNQKSQDKSQAWACYRKALLLDPKHLLALHSLGVLYESGDSVNKDLNIAQDYYRHAAQAGFLPAGTRARIIENDSTRPKYATADEWFALGDEYYSGNSTTTEGKIQNYTSARECYEVAISLNANHKGALYSLGILYGRGLNVAKDIAAARGYYERAVKENHSWAKKELLCLDNPTLTTAADWVKLGEAYHYGREGKIKANDLAWACFQRAFELDNNDFRALYVLGWLFEHGQGVDKSLRRARAYYERALHPYYDHKKDLNQNAYESIKRLMVLNHPEINTADAWLNVASFFDNTTHLDDRFKRRACYELALSLDENHHGAHFSIGLFYEYGLAGLTLSLYQAREHYEHVHTNIGKRRIKEVERKMIEENISTKKGLDLVDGKNRTALHRAAQDGHLMRYARLKYMGANPEVLDGSQKTSAVYLSAQQQEKINALHRKFTHEVKMHFQPACQVVATAISAQGGTLDRAEIEKALDEMYAIPEIQPLLELIKLAVLAKHQLSRRQEASTDDYDSDEEQEVRNDQRLQIILDGQKETVEGIVCVEADGLGGKGALGMYVFAEATRNTVYVGAGLTRKKLAIRGTVIHELTHFIARELYDNNSKPYSAKDTEAEKRFTQISSGMEANTPSDSIFADVFKLYSSSHYHSELIVRVAQFLVSGGPQAAVTLKEKYTDLDDYYRNVFLRDVKKHIDTLRSRAFRGWDPTLFGRHADTKIQFSAASSRVPGPATVRKR